MNRLFTFLALMGLLAVFPKNAAATDLVMTWHNPQTDMVPVGSPHHVSMSCGAPDNPTLEAEYEKRGPICMWTAPSHTPSDKSVTVEFIVDGVACPGGTTIENSLDVLARITAQDSEFFSITIKCQNMAREAYSSRSMGTIRRLR